MSEAKGKKLFVQKCKQVIQNDKYQKQNMFQCHSYEAGGKHGQGPALAGFYGKPAAQSSFNYSDAIKCLSNDLKKALTFLLASGIVWDDSSLEQWLTNPKKFVPGKRKLSKNQIEWTNLRNKDGVRRTQEEGRQGEPDRFPFQQLRIRLSVVENKLLDFQK